MISRRKLYAAGEPFGDACTRVAFGKHRVYGGGGGDSGSNYYENQDRLLGVQADIAQGIYNNIYQPYAPGAVRQLSGMVEEANSGALTERARATAGADAGAAIGQGIDAANRNLTRYGINPNSAKFASMNTTNALNGAAIKADAMNKAEQWGAGQKWGRTYDFYNSLSGVPSQASSSLGSAAAGYGQMAGRQSDADQANAAGFGRAGGMFGRAIFSKDGGLVRSGRGRAARVARGGVRLANGGLMQLPDWRSRPTNVRSAGGADPLTSFAGSAAMGAGTEVLKGVAKPYLDPIKAGIKGILSPAAEAGSIGGTSAEGLAAADTAAGLIPGAEGAAAAGTAAAAEGATAAGAAAAEGAAAAAGSTALTAVGTAMPWVGAGLLVAKGLGLFKNGGRVDARRIAAMGIARRDMSGGGPVRGPGGPREDKVPAQLSDGEYVLPAKTTKALGGPAVLDPIVQATNDGRPPATGRKRERVDGGLFGRNLGVALGAATDEINRGKVQDRADRADARAEETLALHKQSVAQQMALNGVQIGKAKREEDEATTVRNHLQAWQQGRAKIQAGDYTDFAAEVQSYNNDQAPFNDGKKLLPQNTAEGPVFNHVDATGRVLATYRERDALKLYDEGMARKLQFLSPNYFEASRKAQAEANQKEADRATKKEVAKIYADARLYAADAGVEAAGVRADGTVEAAGVRARERGGLTVPQQRTNDSIEAARQQISGLDQAEVLALTQPSIASGRANDRYDPQLARTVKLANTRKYGEDPTHDAFTTARQKQNQATSARADVAKRFRSDPAMLNRTLGKETPNGVEVLEKGRVIGHYR